MKQEYEMTEDNMKELLECAKPVMVIYGNGGTPLFTTPQEKANAFWQALGKKMGFKWDTVKPSEKGNYIFLAEPFPKGE